MPEPMSEYSAQINQEIKDKKLKFQRQRVLPIENAGAVSPLPKAEKRVPDLREIAEPTSPTSKASL